MGDAGRRDSDASSAQLPSSLPAWRHRSSLCSAGLALGLEGSRQREGQFRSGPVRPGSESVKVRIQTVWTTGAAWRAAVRATADMGPAGPPSSCLVAESAPGANPAPWSLHPEPPGPRGPPGEAPPDPPPSAGKHGPSSSVPVTSKAAFLNAVLLFRLVLGW